MVSTVEKYRRLAKKLEAKKASTLVKALATKSARKEAKREERTKDIANFTSAIIEETSAQAIAFSKRQLKACLEREKNEFTQAILPEINEQVRQQALAAKAKKKRDKRVAIKTLENIRLAEEKAAKQAAFRKRLKEENLTIRQLMERNRCKHQQM